MQPACDVAHPIHAANSHVVSSNRDQMELFCWDPFDHSEGSFRPIVKKSEKKSRNGLPGPPGPGGQKSQTIVKNEFKIDFFETF